MGEESACGSSEFRHPFPVSPSGGKPGRVGSPQAGGTLRASKRRWHASMLPAPPTRGLLPPCASPASAWSDRWGTTKITEFLFRGKRSFRLTRPAFSWKP